LDIHAIKGSYEAGGTGIRLQQTHPQPLGNSYRGHYRLFTVDIAPEGGL
jgi:hypothetical protein